MAILRDHGYPIERGGTQFFGQLPDLFGMPDVHLEVKRTERAQIWEWMQLSQRDAERFGDGAPVVIFRRSRSPWLVCMGLTDWIELYKSAKQQ